MLSLLFFYKKKDYAVKIIAVCNLVFLMIDHLNFYYNCVVIRLTIFAAKALMKEK